MHRTAKLGEMHFLFPLGGTSGKERSIAKHHVILETSPSARGSPHQKARETLEGVRGRAAGSGRKDLGLGRGQTYTHLSPGVDFTAFARQRAQLDRSGEACVLGPPWSVPGRGEGRRLAALYRRGAFSAVPSTLCADADDKVSGALASKTTRRSENGHGGLCSPPAFPEQWCQAGPLPSAPAYTCGPHLAMDPQELRGSSSPTSCCPAASEMSRATFPQGSYRQDAIVCCHLQ